MAFVPLMKLKNTPKFRSLASPSSLNVSDYDGVGDDLESLSVLLQSATYHDKDPILEATCHVPHRIFANISGESDLYEMSSANLNDFSNFEIDETAEHNRQYQAMNRALMCLEDFSAKEVEVSSKALAFIVEASELEEFVMSLREFMEGQDGLEHSKSFCFGGKNFAVTVKRARGFASQGRKLSRAMSVNETMKLDLKMTKAFCRQSDAQVSLHDANCLEGVFDSLNRLREKLSSQIEEAKVVTNSCLRLRRSYTLSTPQDIEELTKKRSLSPMTSSPTPVLVRRRLSEKSQTPEPKDSSTKQTLELELKDLEQSISKCKDNGPQSARLATRLSRVKTELLRIRSQEAIQASKLIGLKGVHKSSATNAIYTEDSFANEDFYDEEVLTPPLKQRRLSFYLEKGSGYDTPNINTCVSKQLKDLHDERKNYEDHRLKTEIELAVRQQKLDIEWTKLEKEKKSLEDLKLKFELETYREKKECKFVQIEQLCSEFLQNIEMLEA